MSQVLQVQYWFLFPTRSRSPASVYYFRCVGVVPMPARVVPGDESGAQTSLADAMPSCSSADKLQAVRTFDAAVRVRGIVVLGRPFAGARLAERNARPRYLSPSCQTLVGRHGAVNSEPVGLPLSPTRVQSPNRVECVLAILMKQLDLQLRGPACVPSILSSASEAVPSQRAL